MIGPEFHLGHDEMHAGAVDFHPGGKRSGMRVEAFEGGKQRRMNIEHALRPAGNQPWRQEPHESCETHEVDAVLLQRICDAALERLPITVPGVINGCRSD